MHPSSLKRCREFVTKYLTHYERLTVADVGSRDLNGSYRALFESPERPGWKYVGFDVASGPNVDIVVGEDECWRRAAERHDFEGSFDVVISGQTLEHIPRPWRWIHQIASLCRPGGLVWLCAPNTWPYHPHPVDCWRVWPDGLRALFEEAGLVTLEAQYLGPDTFGVARAPEPGAARTE